MLSPGDGQVGFTLDAGALIALERGNPRTRALLQRARAAKMPLAVPAGALAQAWRGGPRQAQLARALADPLMEIVVLDGALARAVGHVCGRTGSSDVVDISVVLCAREREHSIVTSDPEDLRAIDSSVRLIVP